MAGIPPKLKVNAVNVPFFLDETRGERRAARTNEYAKSIVLALRATRLQTWLLAESDFANY